MLLDIQLSTVQLPLLLVELVLLVATVSLLILNRKDAKSREAMMDHFSSVADVITRQEYFVAVVDGIRRAERRLCGSVTGSPPSHEESEVITQILGAVNDAAKRGVEIRYLLPLLPDRLQMAKKYGVVGAQVKLHPALLISDARYMLIDEKEVLVGVPERRGKNEPTRKGYSIPSESVSHLFKVQFENQWSGKEAKTYEQYLSELVGQARVSNPNISAELIANNLAIEKDDVEVALTKNA